MFEILGFYGIPSEIINAIRVLYSNTCSSVLTPDCETEPFNVLTGIIQGDTLATFLLIFIDDYIMRTSVNTINERGVQYQLRRSSRNSALHITDADFADDKALLSDNLENAQVLLLSLESAANCTGLHLNEKTTECMPINIQGDFQIRNNSNNVLKRTQS